MNDEIMKTLNNRDPEMLEEYDFRQGRRGRYAARHAGGTNLVLLDPDVAAEFPDAARVNAALRQLLGKPAGTRTKKKRVAAKQSGPEGRSRDENGEVHRKRSDTLVGTLRKEYGEDFLPGFRSTTTLGAVLKKRGAESLSDLLKTKKRR